MEHHTTTSRAEAERLLGIAEKLLRSKDFSGSRDFAILAQETEPLLEGSDQILAVAEVLLADNKRLTNNQPDWYAVLQLPQRADDPDLIKRQYRRLALLLHPDKNKYPFSDSAFRLVADSWAVLSDPLKKAAYDKDFIPRFTKVDLTKKQQQQQQQQQQQFSQSQKKQPPHPRAGGNSANPHQKLPVRRSARGGDGGSGGAKQPQPQPQRKSGGGGGGLTGNFWTACPYCYNLYEYPRAYEGCCLRCDSESCRRAFTATEVLSVPPMVPGREAYYCCWGFFPMGFVTGDVNGFPKWMPEMFGGDVAAEVVPPVAQAAAAPVNAAPVSAAGVSSGKKRGRPRKNL